jgi:hypothetical protein
MRVRDALGRPVPEGSPEAVEPVPEEALPASEALDLAQSLLDQGRAFFAHEVLEAVWKAQGRDAYWQGLAQLCVGITHLQRGNVEGAITEWGLAEADRLASGDLAVPQLRLRDSGAQPP